NWQRIISTAVVEQLTIERDFCGVWFAKPGNGFQERCFARARRSEDCGASVLKVNIDIERELLKAQRQLSDCQFHPIDRFFMSSSLNNTAVKAMPTHT